MTAQVHQPFDDFGNTKIVQDFGATGGPAGGHHTGIDYGIVHKPLYAMFDSVVKLDHNWGGGNAVRMYMLNPDGTTGKGYILYGHLRDFAVKDGQKISAGTIVGTSGGALNDPGHGISTGTHVHIEAHNPDGSLVNPHSIIDKLKGIWSISGGMTDNTPSIPNPLDGVGAVADAIKAPFVWLGAHAYNVLFVVLASFFIIGGTMLYSKTMRDGAQTAVRALPMAA